MTGKTLADVKRGPHHQIYRLTQRGIVLPLPHLQLEIVQEKEENVQFLLIKIVKNAR